MLHRQSISYILLAVFLDFLALATALISAPFLRNQLALGRALGEPERFPPLIALLTLLIWLVVFSYISIYDPYRPHRLLDELQKVVLGALFILLILAGLLFFSYRDLSRLMIVYFFGLYLSALVGWRVLLRFSFYLRHSNGQAKRRFLVIGTHRLIEEVSTALFQDGASNLELIGFISDEYRGHIANKPVLGQLNDTRHIVEQHKIDDVIVTLPHEEYEKLNHLVVDLQTLPLNVHIVPDYFNLALYRATVEDFGGLPLIHLRDPALTPYQRLNKRIFDILVGSILLILTAPFMLLVAIAVKLDSRGPIIFKQERVGENGRLFTMYKFRSMIDGAEADPPALIFKDHKPDEIIHKMPDDPRATRIGRFIRQTSLDELPQLINVLMGDMSLVGPRPEMPWLVDKYEPWQRKRFAVPQGITGWWQVNSRSHKLMHLNTEDDLYYIQNYSLLLDFQILWKTVGAVIRRQGAF